MSGVCVRSLGETGIGKAVYRQDKAERAYGEKRQRGGRGEAGRLSGNAHGDMAYAASERDIMRI